MLWNSDHHKVNADLFNWKIVFFFLERWPGFHNNEMKALRDKQESLDRSLTVYHEN